VKILQIDFDVRFYGIFWELNRSPLQKSYTLDILEAPGGFYDGGRGYLK
jgi:hypothetical protein